MTPATKKKARRRPSPKRMSAARQAKRPATVSIHAMSPTRQAKLFRAFRKVMKEHGVADEIAAVHLAPAAGAARGGCPPGQVSRVVCVRKPDGSVVCQSQCQPI